MDDPVPIPKESTESVTRKALAVNGQLGTMNHDSRVQENLWGIHDAASAWHRTEHLYFVSRKSPVTALPRKLEVLNSR